MKGRNMAMKSPAPQSGGKIKMTLNLSRAAVAVLDRVRAKRLEQGVGRRAAQPSNLVEEAIELLKQKEGL
jgi:hypothetical protein